VLVWLGFLGAACSFTMGWSMHPPAAISLPLAALYAFAALGDLPVLSAAMTESVEAGNLGSALAVTRGNGLPAAWARGFSLLGAGGVVDGLRDNSDDT
jgi:hypothetical protein